MNRVELGALSCVLIALSIIIRLILKSQFGITDKEIMQAVEFADLLDETGKELSNRSGYLAE